MDQGSISQNVKTTILEFVGDIRDNVLEREEDRQNAAKISLFFTILGPDAVMGHVIKHVLPHAEQIRSRNVVFFVEEKDHIFRGLPTGTIDRVTRMITTPAKAGGISDENREVIWQYFDTLVALAEMAKKTE